MLLSFTSWSTLCYFLLPAGGKLEINHILLLSFTSRREQLLNREKSSSLDSGLARDSMKSLKRSNTISASRGIAKYTQKLNMGEARDDVHVCIMCLRAIMNHQVRCLLIPVYQKTFGLKRTFLL